MGITIIDIDNIDIPEDKNILKNNNIKNKNNNTSNTAINISRKINILHKSKDEKTKK